MVFFIKSLNRRWTLYVTEENNAVYAMHGNSVMRIVGYAMGYFANGSSPRRPWELYLSSNHQEFLLTPEHFTSDGENPTPLLIQQIESIDSRWNGFKTGELWCEDIAKKKDIKISDYTPGKIDVQSMFNNRNKPRELTFLSVLDEIFEPSRRE
jgi:hypothetical protein